MSQSQSAGPDMIREMSIKHYEQGERLGSGGQGTVYKYIYDGNDYAAKVLYWGKADMDSGLPLNRENILREQFIAPKLTNAHLVKAHQVFQYPEGFVIIMPYFRRGSLEGVTLELTQVKEAVRQILHALRYLHERDYIHRDIKAHNVMVRNRKGAPLDLAVGDFGMISLERPISYVGTPGYMAPEVVRNGGKDQSQASLYRKNVDVYSLGVLILHLLGAKIPDIIVFSRNVFKDSIKSLVDTGLRECGLDDDERRGALLAADYMLQYDPKTRPSVAQCLNLSWLIQPATPLPPLEFSTMPLQFLETSPILATSVVEVPSNRSSSFGLRRSKRERREKKHFGPSPIVKRTPQKNKAKLQPKARPKSKAPETQRDPLPTPDSSPNSGRNATPLLSWDKMQLSD